MGHSRNRKRPPAYRKTRHQLDEVYIDHVDYRLDFEVHWELDEDYDGKPLGYRLDTISLLFVERFDGEKYVPFEADPKLRADFDEAIRHHESRYQTLTEEAERD